MTLPSINRGLGSLSTPDRTPRATFGSGLPDIRLRYSGDVARFYFLNDDAVATALFHEDPRPTKNGNTFYANMLCLRRQNPQTGEDEDPPEACRYCSSEFERVRKRMMRMVALVFHEWTAHQQQSEPEWRSATRGDRSYFLEDVNTTAIYLTRSRRTLMKIREYEAENGSLAQVFSFPDMSSGGSTEDRTLMEGKVRPFEVSKLVDGRQINYDLEARPSVDTFAAIEEARRNLPDLAKVISQEYVDESKEVGEDPTAAFTQEPTNPEYRKPTEF